MRREGSKLRTAKWIEQTLQRLVFGALGDRPIADIRRSEIVRLLDQIDDNSGPVMADRTLAIIVRSLTGMLPVLTISVRRSCAA